LVDAANHQNHRQALCRFAAENLLTETAALKQTVVGGASSLAAARAILMAGD
jgi:hypothetical protein